MQSRPSSDPTSWIYQANMHGTEDRPLLAGWESCQHGSFFLLSWHRMELYYFERILRKASGDPNLTLPYWNYSDPADPNARALPLPLRQPQTASNPLYVAQRDSTMNAGGLLPPSAVSLSALTDYTNFTPKPGSNLSFGGVIVTGPVHNSRTHSALESTPHDVIHGVVGGVGNGSATCCWMGSFTWAARDPIFWLHHANIDRLWEQWLALGGGRSNPTDQVWLDTQFEFFDENGLSVKLSGKEVVATAAQLNYVYNHNPWDESAQLPEKPARDGAQVRPGSVRQLGTSKVPAVELRREPVTVPIPIVTEDKFQLLGAERAMVLNVEGIELEKMPGGYYEIYMNLPQGERPDFQSKNYVGNLSFFGLPTSANNHAGEEAARYSYDITKIINRLKSDREWKGREVRVTFVKQDVIPPPGMKPTEEAAPVPVRIHRLTITTE